MLSNYIRIIHSDNGTTNDYSIANANSNDSYSAPITTAEDYIYIGQYYPFNNFHVEMGSTVNDVVGDLSVHYWNGNDWEAAVDILDGTSSASKCLSQSGVVMFEPNRNAVWNYIDDTSSSSMPSDLQGYTIYGLYWLRISCGSTLTAGTVLKGISYAFTNNDTLVALDPDINDYLTAWGGVGKLDWNEQIRVASTMMAAKLKRKKIIYERQNILRFDDFYLPTAYLCLANIYTVLGPSFAEKKASALTDMNDLLSIGNYTVDKDGDASQSRDELRSSVTRAIR